MSLKSISPVDGRYCGVTAPLQEYFSEFAFIRSRVRVEVEYFIALSEIPLKQLEGVSGPQKESLRSLYLNFSETDAQRVKDIEKAISHDMKAVEYFVKEHMDALGMGQWREFIHFGLTSQDINNTAQPLMTLEALREVMLPSLDAVSDRLRDMAGKWKDVPMLARTHGQAATPTRVGKELAVFVERLSVQEGQLLEIPLCAKFGGATGNFNAHHAAYPDIDWNSFADRFIGSLGLIRSCPTTQIEHYDNLAALFNCLSRINTILLDLSRDMWMYISMGYFSQKIVRGEVGSSAMPHKVNPIDFENAEGNLGVADALFGHMAAKLPVSRLQRDLSDSTVLRNTGVPMAHTLIALKSLCKGLDRVTLNTDRINEDLDGAWAVVAEGIQTILRREGYPEPYEALKALTRTGRGISREVIAEFIDSLAVTEQVRAELHALTPRTYTGI